MNLKNLRIAIKYFENLPDPRTYDQMEWGKGGKPTCNTPACIAGHISHLFDDGEVYPFHPSKRASEILELSEEISDALFLYPVKNRPSPLYASRVLQHLHDTNEVSWYSPLRLEERDQVDRSRWPSQEWTPWTDELDQLSFVHYPSGLFITIERDQTYGFFRCYVEAPFGTKFKMDDFQSPPLTFYGAKDFTGRAFFGFHGGHRKNLIPSRGMNPSDEVTYLDINTASSICQNLARNVDAAGREII